MSRRFLVTGADGFAGKHIVDWLLDSGHDVIRLMRSVPDDCDERTTDVIHDLTQPLDLDVEVDVVVSAASSTDIAGSISDPVRVFRQNVDIVANIAEWCRWKSIQAFVQVSSEEVYGPAPHGLHKEWEPIRPSTHYSASKAAQEAYLIASWRSHGLPLVILNCMNMIGPGQDGSKLVPTILRKLRAGEPAPLLVDYYEPQSGTLSESIRQYMHPRVLASAVEHAVQFAKPFTPSDVFPARFNVAGEQVGNVELAKMIADEAGLEFQWVPVEANLSRPGHERVFGLDTAKLESSGWVSPMTLAEAIREIV